MKKSDIIMGVILIILGILFLADNLEYITINFTDIWPFLMVLGGAAFWTGYFKNRKNYGLIMPGTILVIYGLVFWYCQAAGWEYMQYLWPFFLIGPGTGFYFMYQLGGKEKGLLIPAGILVGMGMLFILQYSGILKYWSVLLIIFGAYLIYKHFKAERKV
jgi:hypothetical protein